jgi:hypothetical protein
MLHALNAHELSDARGRSPPEDAAFEKGAGKGPEMASRKRMSLDACELG